MFCDAMFCDGRTNFWWALDPLSIKKFDLTCELSDVPDLFVVISPAWDGHVNIQRHLRVSEPIELHAYT